MMVALIFAAINLPTVSVWAIMGQGLRQVLSSPARLRVFDWTMAALLLVSAFPVLQG